MLEFAIDKTGEENVQWEKIVCNTKAGKGEDDEDVTDEEEEDNKSLISLDYLSDSSTEPLKKKNKSEFDDISLENTYLTKNYLKEGNNNNKVLSNIDKIMEKSVLKPGFEQLNRIPVPKGKNAIMRERKALRKQNKGKEWYNMPAPKITDEIKNDLEILKMRSALDPKHMYKKNDVKVTPKYFHIGKVVEGPAEYYSSRIPKTQRKKTLVDELLADSNFKAYQKKKYKEIVDDNRRRKKPKKEPTVRKKTKREIREEWMKFD